MPSVSKAQNAAMFAAASGHSTLGIPKKVGQEFSSAQTPGSVKNLPQHVKTKHAAKRGMISERAKKRRIEPDNDGEHAGHTSN